MSKAQAGMDYRLARGILYEEAAKAAAGYVDQSWVKPIEALSEAAAGKSLTHIAFLGTAILAKCTVPTIDVFSVKKRGGENTYSARGLCHGVLVPNAPELDISLGVTGREPLNNQPYVGIDRLTRAATVRSTVQGVLNLLCDILDRLEGATEEQARQALRAYIEVRRRHGTRYSRSVSDRVAISIDTLVRSIDALVSASSEGGRRAQAVVAGLMDVFAGADRVDARRINDPSRTIPADVNVRRRDGEGWERVFEVRDKAVSREDLYLLVNKCIGGEVDEAVMVAIAPSPSMSLLDEARAWAAERGVSLSVCSDWATLVGQALHWGPLPTLDGASELPGRIEQRLIELEVTEEALTLWGSLISIPGAAEGSA
ncbi:MAG: restriction endonuclease, SacI family [Sphingomonas sp.]|uniref:restriction endonuclease, SacI family n=1 Tax=Sphingomonas sp. TaxID=28214 RepID=UPI0022730943|nr:restriction endonuclease, SacI family [Sphingomonas sp.]MCX8476766.1 restriction endonuclease, SacI family [Sphingomonas sp.]